MNADAKTILIADDSPTMRLMLEEILQSAGYRVITAEDGIQAAEMAFRHHPDLIISDIEMPKMDGYQVSRLLKNDPVLANTPVIILTSKDSSGAVFWGYQTGADLYLLKDFKPQDLLSAITDLLARYEPQAARLRAAPTEAVDSFQILEKLNRFLDDKLFEVTLINEITRISVSMTAISETLADLLTVMERAIDSHILAFAVFTRESEILLSVKLGRRVPMRLLELFQFQVLEDLGTLMNTDLAESKIAVELGGEPLDEAGGGVDDLEIDPTMVYSIPIRAKEENIGILNVYHPGMERLPVQQKQLLGRLGPYFSATINATLMYDKIKNLSVIDGLTQLYNRRCIMENYRTEFNKAVRYTSDFSLLMLDIDNFKVINDSYGHLTGDLVLKTLSNILKSNIRNIDLPGRYGGEEFLLLLPGTAKENARIVAERIREQVEKHPFKTLGGERITITISQGLCDMNDVENKSNELELIKIADSRLYQAKKTGKNKVVAES